MKKKLIGKFSLLATQNYFKHNDIFFILTKYLSFENIVKVDNIHISGTQVYMAAVQPKDRWSPYRQQETHSKKVSLFSATQAT